MAVPFSNTKLRVPKGFQNVLEGLAREVLRNQPDNIYEFGAKYFEQMLAVRGETGHDPAVHGARLEDRFYNNDSFKSPVVDAGDPQQQEAALQIQTEYRRHAAAKEVEGMKEEEAALTIQSSFRGHQDREKVKQMIDEKSSKTEQDEEVDIDLTDPDVEKAAVKIQAGFKGYKARKEVKTEKEEKIESKSEEIDIDLKDPEVEKAATKIQAGFRGHKTRQEMKGKTESQTDAAQTKSSDSKQDEIDIDLNDPEVEKAATKIQAGFRGHKTRKEMQSQEPEVKTTEKQKEAEEEIDIDLNDPEVEKAAIKIQAGFKGFQTRKEMQSKSEEVVPEKQDEEEEIDIDLNDPEVEKAAIKIQAGFKGFQTRKEMQSQKEGSAPVEVKTEEVKKEDVKKEDAKKEEEEVDIDLDDPDTANAALKIQAGFRGYKTRKELQGQIKEEKAKESQQEEAKTDSKQESKEEVDIDLNDPEVEKAATKIQAGFKGYKTRKDMKDKTDSSEQKTDEQKSDEKTDEGEKKVEEIRITINPTQASTIMNVLSAFPSYKKPKDLPDHLVLSKWQIRRIKQWHKKALENMEKPTFKGTNRLAVGAFKMFDNKHMFDISDDESEQSEKSKERSRSFLFSDSDEDSDDDDDLDDFNFDDMGKFFGGMFGGLNKEKENNEKLEMDDFAQNAKDLFAPMMSGFVDKKIAYQPYKVMAESLEPWIENNRDNLSNKELAEREEALEVLKLIVSVYEEEEEGEPKSVRENRNAKILEIITQNEQVLKRIPPEIEEKSQENFEQGKALEMMPDLMDALGKGMGSMFNGLESLTKKDSKFGEEEDDDENCTIL